MGWKFRLIACEASSAARTLFGKLRLGLVGISDLRAISTSRRVASESLGTSDCSSAHLTMAARSTIAAVISISKVLGASLRLILSRRPTIPVHLTGVRFTDGWRFFAKVVPRLARARPTPEVQALSCVRFRTQGAQIILDFGCGRAILRLFPYFASFEP